MSEQRRKRGSLLGVAAYLLVPGERRRRAARHFRRAGLEAILGVRALASVGNAQERNEAVRRERIEIE